jgi:hypothetical protein
MNLKKKGQEALKSKQIKIKRIKIKLKKIQIGGHN